MHTIDAMGKMAEFEPEVPRRASTERLAIEELRRAVITKKYDVTWEELDDLPTLMRTAAELLRS